MTPGQITLLTGGAILAYLLFSKVHAGGNLNFYPDKVTDISVSSGNPIMTVLLRVQNTSGQNFTVNSIAGNVYANQYLIGNAENFQPVQIHPNSQALLPVRLRLNWFGIVNDIINAFEGGPFKQVVEFEATANVDNLQIPVNVVFNIGK